MRSTPSHRRASRRRPRRGLTLLVTGAAVAALGGGLGAVPVGAAPRPMSAGSVQNGSSVAASAALSLPTMPAGSVASASVAASSAAQKVTAQDLGSWSVTRLAKQLLFVSTGSKAGTRLVSLARQGLGGIMVQAPIPGNIKTLAAKAKAAAPHGAAPLIASDEEGGQVQRFKSLLGALPSAKRMNGYSPAKIKALTRRYGAKLAARGVSMVFGPVLGLSVAGGYLTGEHRTFAASPARVWKDAQAWCAGYAAAGIVTVVKHWPGEGHAKNTHAVASKVPALSVLERRDMVPFNKAFAAGAKAVMVGHVEIPGLTEKRTPASESKKALAYLRAKAGPDAVIVTDSLSMAAASSAAGLSITGAAVKALAAGADMALVVTGASSSSLVKAVAKAIRTGKIPRAAAQAKAARVLNLKAGL